MVVSVLKHSIQNQPQKPYSGAEVVEYCVKFAWVITEVLAQKKYHFTPVKIAILSFLLAATIIRLLRLKNFVEFVIVSVVLMILSFLHVDVLVL
ncbi:unnamed protein product [Thelazia callipaeda]|uniref:Transmembrane protein n=1 Tax=Thelazia callipaeda TaxID=103827 RepID=A0A158RB51_THECL|nr:unnamed protein product [Thelazia callipaeda]